MLFENIAMLHISKHFENRFDHSKSDGVVIIAGAKLAMKKYLM